MPVGADSALAGVAERGAEPQSLNVLPASWADVLSETRFKGKLVRYLSVAVGIWALAMGVLFGVPVVYGFMADSQKAETRRRHAKYVEVKTMVDKVNLVRKYSDHERSALELLKAQPEEPLWIDLPYHAALSIRRDDRDGQELYLRLMSLHCGRNTADTAT